MIEYEVTITIDQDIYQAYTDWLKLHIKDMLEIKGFVDAKSFSVDISNKKVVCVRYYVESKKALKDYIENVAPTMRGSYKSEFENKFEISRRVLIEGDI